jgi:Flp pilus assembly protein CpaB
MPTLQTSPRAGLAPLRRRARRLVRRHRRPLGALLVGVAALLALQQLRPPPTPTVPVVVADRLLAAGTVLQPSDLTLRQVPVEAVAPSAVADPERLVGRTLAGPVPAGEPLSTARLRGPQLLAGQPQGTVALPVRVADTGAAALLAAGDRIDLLAALPDDDGATGLVVAEALPVLLVGAGTGAGSGGGLLGPGAGAGPVSSVGEAGGLVVVAASRAVARDIVAAAAASPLWFTLAPG